MSTSNDLKRERINLRLRPQAKQLLERAASFEGKTVSNFILSRAMARAEKTKHSSLSGRRNPALSQERAQAKNVAFNPLVNDMLRREIDLIEAIK